MNYLKTIILLSLATLFFACDPAGNIIPLESELDGRLVSKNDAIDIAYEFIATKDGSSSSRLTEDRNLTVNEIKGSHEKTALYIINNQAGGWLIVAGSNVEQPILAYSLDGQFDIDIEKMNEGLKMWISNSISQMVLAYNDSVAYQQQFLVQSSSSGGRQGDPDVPPPPPPCEDSDITVGPLMDTEWHQIIGYNDLVRFNNCAAGTAPTGCVATAMAQIMRYHEFPDTYNWTNMPPDLPTLETQTLMDDIGQAVGMNYSCDLSWIYDEDMEDAILAFRNTFGYQASAFTTFNHLVVKQQINWNRPVILAGFHTENGGGHAWVCDGYRSIFYCDIGTGFLWLSMNWGFGGDDNGFYAFNNWNPPTLGSFNYEKKMIYNIKP